MNLGKKKLEDFIFGIFGRYGTQVQIFLQKLTKFKIKYIFPNHGSILNQNINHYISLYDTWSKYLPDEEGVVIVYSTVYGHTKVAVDKLAEKLNSLGVKFLIDFLKNLEPEITCRRHDSIDYSILSIIYLLVMFKMLFQMLLNILN